MFPSICPGVLSSSPGVSKHYVARFYGFLIVCLKLYVQIAIGYGMDTLLP